MGKSSLLIVESPAKAGTIKGYLGPNFDVEATFGHVRDLPKSKLGVDVENNYAPQYIVPRKQSKQVTKLKQAAKGRETIWLATDLDREGEAIAWHVKELIKEVVGKETTIKRITFNEITKPAILSALEHPAELDLNKVDAQQARRVLDRLVGYTLSPLLWKKLYKGLSAGRVQSVALKFIVDREIEREAFKAQEYWSLEATLKAGVDTMSAFYMGEVDKPVAKDDYPLKTVKEVEQVKKEVDGKPFTVKTVEAKEQQRRPQPPFVTSTLQQAASNRLGFSAKRTMSAAQKLYEHGYITYMRTDSVSLATSAVKEIRAVVLKEFGDEYVPDKANSYRSKKTAQEAHEAIRPTHVRTLPETIQTKLSPDEAKLYGLIWRRTLASQMTPARVNQLRVDVTAGRHLFRATGLTLLFPGFLKVLNQETKDVILPVVKEGEQLDLEQLIEQQHFTEPPARFTEASLIKALEAAGVGRPSTYAPTISTLYARGYIANEGKALVPQLVGRQVIELLSAHFPEIVNVEFTAEMEESLDKIADGQKKWEPVIDAFYKPFSAHVKEKEEKIEKVSTVEETDETCPECGKALVIRQGRYGKFKACSGFPDCKYTEQAAPAEATNIPCPRCGKELVPRRTRRGKTFFGCPGYPDCQFALWDLTLPALEKKVAEMKKEGIELPQLKETKEAIKQKTVTKST